MTKVHNTIFQSFQWLCLSLLKSWLPLILLLSLLSLLSSCSKQNTLELLEKEVECDDYIFIAGIDANGNILAGDSDSFMIFDQELNLLSDIDFTSPTVAIMPIQKEIPNTAFINGSNKIYLAMERAAVFGKETYVTSIEVNKTATDGNFTLISDLYIPDASIVIDSDRPLRENVIVKTNQGPYLRIIKSKYRDVIAIRPALAYDNIIKMIDNLKEDINLLSEVWYETADTDSGSIILYVKAYEGCSEILEGQLVEYFSEGEIQVAVILELKFRKIEYGIFIILSIALGSLLVCLIKSTKRSYKELKKSMAIDIKTFYTFDCIMKNMKGIAATAISALSACFIYYFLFTVMPLPPVPAYVIPEKLIYINDFVRNLADYYKNINQKIASKVITTLDICWYVLLICLLICIIALIFVLMMRRLKPRK